MPVDPDDDTHDYGTEIVYDADLEAVLHRAEAAPVTEIEEAAPVLSPMEEFRRRGYLSVSDLVATVWCEVQYDYCRLRTLPFLPPEKRPQVIKSAKGVEIKVDKVKEAKKEKVLKRGEKVHEKLEREIFPVKISIQTATPEDSWGLRFLTMISALEVLISGGKCRELPVVGFVGDVLVYGIIDEIVREALPELENKGKETDKQQTSLDAFLGTQPTPTQPTHTLRVSDSKTRASGTIPRPEDSQGGRLQVMMYKELLDALLHPKRETEADGDMTLLPTAHSSVLDKVFATLGLDPAAEFSEAFNKDAVALISSNALRKGAREAKTLAELVAVWEAYIADLGLGAAPETGDTLALVYRRATPQGKARRFKRVKSRKSQASSSQQRHLGSETESDGPVPTGSTVMDEDAQLQLAIRMSLMDAANASAIIPLRSSPEKDAELQLAIQMSLQQTADVPDTEASRATSPQRHSSPPLSPPDDRTATSASLVTDLPPTVSPPPASPVFTPSASLAGHRRPASDTETDAERAILYDQLALAAELTHAAEAVSFPGVVEVPVSSQEKKKKKSASAGDIIGTATFTHNPALLARHLASVLGYWKGSREPKGVGPSDVRRCGWCEFEEGCEWRAAKAAEAWRRYQSRRTL